MAKRERTKTRADMIALLKSRGVRGRLSKMTKAQLRGKLEDTEPPEDQEGDGRPSPPRSGELELEADPQGGGHFYKADGATSSTQSAKYKHAHRKKDWPAQTGSGSASAYRTFMAKEMKQNGGNMKAAADAYKAQKGGHMVKMDGDVSAVQATKYKHAHAGDNPATSTGAAPRSAAAKPASSTTTAKATRAKRATAKPASSLPSALAPSTKTAMRAPATEDDSSQKTPTTSKSKPKRRQAMADESIFDTLEQKKAKAKATEDATRDAARAQTKPRKRSVTASVPATPKPKASRRMSDADKVKNAKARLKAGKYASAYMKHKDQAYAKGIFGQATISANWDRVKVLKKRDDYDAQNVADDREMAGKEHDEALSAATQPAKAAIRAVGRIPKKKKQTGSGGEDPEQDGGGHWYDAVGHWAKKHESGLIETGVMGIGALLGGPVGMEAAEGLEGVIEASDAAETTAAAEESAGDALDGATDDKALDAYNDAHTADEEAIAKKDTEIAKRQAKLGKPSGMRSALRAGREQRMLESGNYVDKPGVYSSLTSKAALAQMGANAKVAGVGAAILAADEGLKSLNPEPDSPPPSPAPSPAPAPAPAPVPGDARAQQRADAYSSNYDMLYGHHGDEGSAYPWS